MCACREHCPGARAVEHRRDVRAEPRRALGRRHWPSRSGSTAHDDCPYNSPQSRSSLLLVANMYPVGRQKSPFVNRSSPLFADLYGQSARPNRLPHLDRAQLSRLINQQPASSMACEALKSPWRQPHRPHPEILSLGHLRTPAVGVCGAVVGVRKRSHVPS